MLCIFQLAGCATTGDRDFLTIHYQRNAQVEGPDRNPVLVVPGLLGSTLRDTGSDELIWGGFDGVSVNPERPDGLRALALPFNAAADGRVNDDDGVEPTWVLERAKVRLLGLPFNLNVYAGILQALGAGGYRDESLGTAGVIDYGPGHFTCFQFPYDWRRDIVESAQKLHAYIEDRARYVEQEYAARFGGTETPVRFDIVAHSMGGLVVRYYLMYGAQDLPADGSLPALTWAGAKRVERAVLVATPNAGSTATISNLLNGLSLGFLQPTYSATLLGTYPSTYQLMPRAGANAAVWADTDEPIDDLLSPELWAENGWGLAAPTADEELRILLPDLSSEKTRRHAALALQRRLLRRAAQFQRAMDQPAAMPDGLSLLLVVGDNRRTAKQVAIARAPAAAEVVQFGDGDGTVLRASVLHDQRNESDWQPTLRTPLDYDHALFLPDTHKGLTDNPTFTDNILYWLLEDPR
ncbi:MAG: hypothetical protein AAF290_08160 [Pseudomonadota bacterium]